MSNSDIPELDAWINRVASALETDIEGVDLADLLDVARDVAHNQVRPGAPTSTFVIGLAAGIWQEQQRAAGVEVTAELRQVRVHELSVAVQQLATETDA